MSKEVRLPSLQFLQKAMLDVFLRFPATMLAALTATCALFVLIEVEEKAPYAKIWMLGQLGLPLLTALALFAESRRWTGARYYGLLAGGIGALVGYYFTLDLDGEAAEYRTMPRYLGFMLIAHLGVAFAPYLNRRRAEDFWEFNKELFAHFVTAAVFSGIIWGGLSAAILAVVELFGLVVSFNIYARLFALVGGLFLTTYFLHHVPRNFEFEEKTAHYSALFRNLCKYILIPLVILYFLILYVYGAKILLNWELPHGWVSSLVIGFSIAGIFTYLLNYLLPQYDSAPAVRLYHRWFWWVLLPLVALLFVAIGRRILDYGVTEERFVVAHTGLWLLVTALYFSISRTDNIKFIPISLAVFAAVAVLGPFNAFTVAQYSQVRELEKLLVAAGRLESGKGKTAIMPVSADNAARIQSALEFLERRNALDAIQPWFNMPLDSLPAPARFSTRPRTAGILYALDISTEQMNYASSIYVNPNTQVSRGNIRGYHTFYRLDISKDTDPPGAGKYVAMADDSRGIVWREKKGTRWTNLEVFDLGAQIDQWAKKSEYGQFTLPDGGEVLDFNGSRAEMRLFIFGLTLEEDGVQPKLQSINGLLLVKDKQSR
jgi:hypothetical protein